MTLALSTLENLNAADVLEQLAQLQASLQANNPTLDTRRGVIHDIVLGSEAQFAELIEDNIELVNTSGSLLAITQDPEGADESLVDAVMSNYNLTRSPGGAATGEVTIVVNANSPVTIGQGAIFTSGALQFTSDDTYAAKSSQALITLSTDRLLQPLGDGTFAFNINVTAAVVGTASQLTQGTLLLPAIPPVTFLKAYATADFTGGLDPQTNTELLALQQEGIAAKALSGSINMNAALRDVPEFANIVVTSVVGYGNPAMLRDMHTIFPLHFGGRIDWYIRSTPQVEISVLTKTATLIQINPDLSGVWQLSIGRDDAPGFYDVVSILPSNSSAAGSLQILADVRGTDMTSIGTSLLPDMVNPTESAYSRFQTAVIQFLDTATPTTGLIANKSTASYSVSVRGLSLIADMHDYVASNGVRFPTADILVKAPVPCFVQLSFIIFIEAGDPQPDTVGIAQQVAQVVNATQFVGRLFASNLTGVIQQKLASHQSVGAIDMFGKIRRPDGGLKYLRSNAVLQVVNDPANMVSDQTVQFFVTPSDIAIAVQTLSAPET